MFNFDEFKFPLMVMLETKYMSDSKILFEFVAQNCGEASQLKPIEFENGLKEFLKSKMV